MSFGINYNTESSGYYSLGSLCSAGIADNSGSLLDSLNVMTMANSADSGSKNTVVYTPVAPTVGSIDSAGTINSANSICVGNTGKVGSSDSASSAGGAGSAGSAGGAGSAGSTGSLNSSDSADSAESTDNDTVDSSNDCRGRRKEWGNLWDEDNDNLSDNRLNDNISHTLLDEVASLFSQNKNFDNAFLMDIQTGIAEMVETKDVDKTQYILDRIAFFAEMKAENPDMSYEEINEKFGQALVYESIVNELYAGYSLIFGTDFVNSGIELTDLAEYALVEADENPLARLMYYETMSLGYLTLASNGELTNQEYLNLRRMDLLKTFPGYFNLSDINKKELYDKICTLTPSEIDKFQKEILNLPNPTDAGYPNRLAATLNDFDSATIGRNIYTPNNGDSIVSYNEVFKSRYNEGFNPDEVIAYKQFEANAQAAVAIDSTRNEILTILDSAKTESSMSEAIFTALFMLTDSTDDKVLTEKLQELTGMQNIQVQNGCVSIIQTQSGSGQQPARAHSQDSLTIVVDNLKNGINTNSDASIAVLTQDAPEDSKGFFGKIGDMFGQFSTEYIGPIVDSIGLSEQTLGYIEVGAGIVGGGLLVAGLICGGWTLVAGASVAGAISAGAGYAGGLKELNDLYNDGEIELYDEYGNWSPDERAQAILDNMETDAALATVDLLSAGVGSKIAGGAKVATGAANFLSSLGVSSAKIGRYTAYAQAGISNGINAAANMTAAGVLTGDGNVGTNIAFAGLGAVMDIKSSNLSNISDVFERSNSNKLKQYNAMRESLVGSYLSKNEWVDGTDITKVLMGKCTVNLDYFAKNLQEGQSIVIGRDYFDLDDVYMSRSHLELKKENGRLYLKDISTNGTKILGIKHPSHLDKYKTSIKAPVDYEDFLYGNLKTLFDEFEFSKDLTWLSHHSSNEEKNAWKIHIYADNYTDWAKLCEALIPYFKDNDISMKTVGPSFVDDMFSGNNIQSGKAFTIYPKNNIEMTQIAKDIDYIIRNNNLMTNNSSIMGDNQLGNTGRLFYRYEYDSKKYQNTIVDTSTPEGIAAYSNMYDANRGDHNYLANDMTIDDDIWRDFDPSNPYSMPYQSTNSSNKNNMANGLAVAATVVASLGLTDANAQTPSDISDTPDDPGTPNTPNTTETSDVTSVTTRDTQQDIELDLSDSSTETIPGTVSETVIELDNGDKKIKVDIATDGNGNVVSEDIYTSCLNGEITSDDLLSAISAIQGLVNSGQMAADKGNAIVNALRTAVVNMIGDSLADNIANPEGAESNIPNTINGYGENTIFVKEGNHYVAKEVSSEYKKAFDNLIYAGMDPELAYMLLNYLDNSNDYSAISNLASNFDIDIKSPDVVRLVQNAENKLKSEIKDDIADWIKRNCRNGSEYTAYMNMLGINSNTSLGQLENLYAILSSGAITIEKVGDSDYGYLKFGINSDYGNMLNEYMEANSDAGEVGWGYDYQFYQNILGRMQDDAARLAKAMQAWANQPVSERGEMPSAEDYLNDYEDEIAYHQFNSGSIPTSIIL